MPEYRPEIERLAQRWSRIRETPESPRSTMDIIEYGLGNQRRAELYVNRLMCYLLDPENPHGMGTDLLDTVLQELPAELGFVEDTYDLSTVRVNEQVGIRHEDEGWQKYPDLVIDVPGEWFLLIELKFSAGESGLEDYPRATEIGGVETGGYESGQYYLYLHQHDESKASSKEFTNWTWRSFVRDVLDEIITEKAPRYPQRTAAQLHELRDDLRNITNMSDEPTADSKKIELYIEHVDAIEDVSKAFQDAWGSYSERWDNELAERLAEDEKLDITSQFDGRYAEALVRRADTEDERWVFRANGGDWQHVFPVGWYRHEETLDVLEDRAGDGSDLRIGFFHRMGKYRNDAIRDHQLRFHFRNMGSNPTTFRDIYEEQFYAERERIESLLSETNGTLTGNKLTMIEASYEIPVGDHETIFDAYTEALRDAFVDMVVERPELIRVLGETYDEAVEEFNER